MNERHQGGSHYENDDYGNGGRQPPSQQRGYRASQEWNDEDRVARDVQEGRRGGSQRYADDEMNAGGRGYGQDGGMLQDYDDQGRLRQRGYASQRHSGRRDEYAASQQDPGSRRYEPQQSSIQRSYLPPDRDNGGRSLGPAYGTDMHDPNRFGQDSHGLFRGFAQGLDEGDFGSDDYGRSWGRSGREGVYHGMDQQNFRGRGPKNYTRSDDRIREDLSERLSEDAAIDASEIEVHVKDGTVRLTGTVSNRWMKHRAEDMADRCSGVKDIDNQLRVRKHSEDSTHQDNDKAGNEQGKSSTASSRASQANH